MHGAMMKKVVSSLACKRKWKEKYWTCYRFWQSCSRTA